MDFLEKKMLTYCKILKQVCCQYEAGNMELYHFSTDTITVASSETTIS